MTNIFKQTEEAANAQGVEFGQNIKEASLARYIRKAKAKQVGKKSYFKKHYLVLQANYPKETKLPQEILKILETEAPHLKVLNGKYTKILILIFRRLFLARSGCAFPPLSVLMYELMNL